MGGPLTFNTAARSWSGTGASSRWEFAVLSCFSGILLCLALQPRPLFYGQQNTYFLHGLATAGYGALDQDWMASTKSPIPVFDALVEFTWLALGNTGFYLLHAALFILLAAALLLLLRSSRLEVGSGWSGPLIVFTALAAIWGWINPLRGLSAWTRDGFALQTIVPDKLEPSSFGVLLLASIALFASKRTGFACAAAALASLIHPTYLVSSTVLVLVYLAISIVLERQIIAALGAGVVYIALVSPIVVFLLVVFSPTDAESYRKAAEILAFQRDPHHALPQVWFTRYVVIQVAIIALGILAWIGPHRHLAYALAASSCAILLLTMIAVLVDSAAFYLLFPWRLSVVLVPVATLGIVSRVLDVIQRRLAIRRFSGVFRVTGVALAAALFISSGALTLNAGAKRGPPEYNDPGYEALVRMVSVDSDPTAVYLYPPELFQSFRLRTGHPIVVDIKSHPFKDVEVLAWWARLQWADRFFAGDACQDVPAPYEFNRIVLPQTPGAIDPLILVSTDLLRRCLLSSGHWRSSVSVLGYEVLVKMTGE